jgi:predicted kinase
MNKIVNLNLGKVYIMSGVQNSGKSTFLKQIPKDMIISSDEIRERLTSVKFSYIEGQVKKDLSQDSDAAVFTILNTMLEEKCRLGLTVFVDTTAVNDSKRSSFIKIAKQYKRPYEVLIMEDSKNIDLIFERNSKRDFKIKESVIKRFLNNFQEDSIYPYKLINSDFEVNFIPNEIKEKNLDVIGDIHGLYNQTVSLLEKLGYEINENRITHKEGRKILFLGDFIDRGPDSIECIKLVYKAVNSGHYAILGNHEEKLIKSYKNLQKENSIKGGLAGKITLIKLLKLRKKEQEKLINFLEDLPFYYVDKKNLYVHANIEYGNPLSLNKIECIYGSVKFKDQELKDTDEIYENLYKEGINKYSLIRGHIEQISKQEHVLSLEEKQAYGGYLVAARINNYIVTDILKEKTNFSYENEEKNGLNFNSLIKDKLVIKKENGPMILYKYSKQVFFNNLWSKDKLLLKARGIVLDISGTIIQHPFDKVFNYRENNTGLDIEDNKSVIAVEKMNGFLGNIGFNPFDKKLLVTTTGSFDSDFVGYINDFISKELQSKLMKFFSKRKITLSFEVIHPKDPHIIEYNEKDYGLWLIGARELNEDSLSLTEEELDLIAEEFNFKRPKWFRIKYGELKEKVLNSKLEGYMVREDNKDQLTLLKFKTPFYLVTKFLGRLSDKKIKFMFSNKKAFKKNLDEEFYEIVDIITESMEVENFLLMTNEDRIIFVRRLIEKMI